VEVRDREKDCVESKYTIGRGGAGSRVRRTIGGNSSLMAHIHSKRSRI
jgi:hypothetical protein